MSLELHYCGIFVEDKFKLNKMNFSEYNDFFLEFY